MEYEWLPTVCSKCKGVNMTVDSCPAGDPVVKSIWVEKGNPEVPADILSSTTTSVAFSGSGYSHSVERDCSCLPSSNSLESNGLEIGFKKKRNLVGIY